MARLRSVYSFYNARLIRPITNNQPNGRYPVDNYLLFFLCSYVQRTIDIIIRCSSTTNVSLHILRFSFVFFIQCNYLFFYIIFFFQRCY